MYVREMPQCTPLNYFYGPGNVTFTSATFTVQLTVAQTYPTPVTL